LAGTPVLTDQGSVAIEKIDPKIHTINNKKVVGIIQTVSKSEYLVCFEKHALKLNYPSQRTIMSRAHRVLYNGEMVVADQLIGKFRGVKPYKYNGEVLYNVLLEEHGVMTVNNMVTETLSPQNGIGKLYMELAAISSPEERASIIRRQNKTHVKHVHP